MPTIEDMGRAIRLKLVRAAPKAIIKNTPEIKKCVKDEDESIRRAVQQALKERYPEYLLEDFSDLLNEVKVKKTSTTKANILPIRRCF